MDFFIDEFSNSELDHLLILMIFLKLMKVLSYDASFDSDVIDDY